MQEEVIYTFKHDENVASELVNALDIQPNGGYRDGSNSEINVSILEQVAQLTWGDTPSGKLGKVFYMHTNGCCNELLGVWVLVRKEVVNELDISLLTQVIT
jgi:hypothetical protein